MGVQNLLQLFRRGVEGKSHMADQSFFLFLFYPAPHIKFIKELGTALAQIVEQIKIKISGSRLLQRGIKLGNGLFPCLAVDPCRVLGSQLEFLPRITLHQSLANRCV